MMKFLTLYPISQIKIQPFISELFDVEFEVFLIRLMGIWANIVLAKKNNSGF